MCIHLNVLKYIVHDIYNAEYFKDTNVEEKFIKFRINYERKRKVFQAPKVTLV